MRPGNPPSADILSQFASTTMRFKEAAWSQLHGQVLSPGIRVIREGPAEVNAMTILDKDDSFWKLREVFDCILHCRLGAVNWEALRLIVEA